MLDLTQDIRIIARWFLVLLSCSAVVCMFWSFSGCFSKKKWYRITLVGILMFISIGAYVLNHRQPSVVRMEEDVLYVKPIPKSDIK